MIALDVGLSVLKFAGKAVGLLKDSGIVKTPEDEAKAQTLLSDIYVKELEAQAEFMKADVSEATPAWSLGIRAVVRPMVTLSLHFVAMWYIVDLMLGKTSIVLPQFFQTAYWVVLGFWFGERLLLGVTGKK